MKKLTLLIFIPLLLALPAGATAIRTYRCKPPLKVERRLDARGVNCSLARSVARNPKWSNVQTVKFRVKRQTWTCREQSHKVITCQQFRHRNWQVRITFRINVA